MPYGTPTLLPRITTIQQIEDLARELDLTVVTTRYMSGRYTSTHIEIGTVTIKPFAEPRWRDLGEGPSWQERYTVTQLMQAPIYWSPLAGGSNELWTKFPVVSTLRESGAKWGGVSVAHRNDETPKASTHTSRCYDYQGFMDLGTARSFCGFAASLASRLTVVEVPYDHDPSKSHWVLAQR